ncbi:DoxX family protein [Streptomyces sp. NPDC005017]|uniref:DoxX family protein n=1 Tax=Streptomyces sp. NPDC005017 TaxID=3364706 RepID=UPI00368A8296
MSETTARVSAAASVTSVAGGPSAMGGSSVSRGTSVAESATARGRRARIALRGLQIVLALFFGIASALPKLVGHSSATEIFDQMGWSSTRMYTVGALELAGAIALLVPVLQSVAAMALSGLMVGAFYFQMTAFDGENAATPLILIVPLALIAWARRGHNTELLRLVRKGG